MLSGFPIKTALALVWIIPSIALTAFVTDKVMRDVHPAPAAKPELVKIPIEVIKPDEKAKIVYVELEAEAVPEPSTLLLLPFSLLALLRRRR